MMWFRDGRWVRMLAVATSLLVLAGSVGALAGAADEPDSLTLDDAVAGAQATSRLMSLARLGQSKAELELDEARRVADMVPEDSVTTYEMAQIKYLRPHAAEAEYRLASANVAATFENVALMATEAYVGVLMTRSLIAVAEEARDFADRQVRLATRMHEAGLVAYKDVLDARVFRSEMWAGLLTARRMGELAEMGLRRIAGFDEDRELDLEDVDFSPLGRVNLGSAVSQAHARRYEMLEMNEMVALAGHNLELAQEYTDTGWSDIPIDDLDLPFPWPPPWWEDEVDRSTEYTIPMAIIEYGEATAGWHLIREDIEHQVRAAYLEMAEAEQKVALLEVAVEAATEGLRLAELRYGAGLGSSTEVMTAALSMAEAESKYITAIYDHEAAKARFLHSSSAGSASGGPRGGR